MNAEAAFHSEGFFFRVTIPLIILRFSQPTTSEKSTAQGIALNLAKKAGP